MKNDLKIVLGIMSVSILFGCMFWIADSYYGYYMFSQRVRYLLFQEPLSFMDSLALSIPPHDLFVRVSFFVACIVGGALISKFVSDLKHSAQTLQDYAERLELALMGADLATWDWDIQTDALAVNTRRIEMLGYTLDEIEPNLRAWQRLVHPDDMPDVEKILNAHIQGETDFYETEHRLQHKSGGWVWVLDKGRVIERDANGKPIRACGTHLDITERKQAEEKLRKARNYIANIIDSMPSVLIGVDADNRVTQWNTGAQQATGVSPEDAVGQALTQVFPRLIAEMERVRQAMHSRKVQIDPKRARQENDEIIYEDVTVYPLITNGMEGAVIRVDDVTEQVHLEEMMIQSEKMLSVGGLAAGMAHEINNPLAGIMQTASVMSNRLSQNIPANLKAAEEAGVSMDAIRAFMDARGIPRMLTAINESGRRVAHIVDNMLSFARRSDAQMSSHDVVELLDKTLELAATDYDLKKQYDFKTIEIVRDYADNLPYVPCEDAKIQQVLLNILRNGAEAMQEASTENPTFVLRTRYEKERGMVCIEIADNGPGMAESVRKRAFEPFFTTKPVGVGTGLGLSVSYFIVTENHDGEMDVESTAGEGATFIIRLPLHRRGDAG